MNGKLLDFLICTKVQCDEQGPFVAITLDGKSFRARNDGGWWNLSNENAEPYWTVSLEDSDPLFCERIIAAVGERL